MNIVKTQLLNLVNQMEVYEQAIEYNENDTNKFLASPMLATAYFFQQNIVLGLPF